jgi:hypothetical protein
MDAGFGSRKREPGLVRAAAVVSPEDKRLPLWRASLLQDCWARGFEHCQSRSRLIDQWLNDDRRYSDAFHIECIGSARREVENASASVWTPIVYFDDNGAVVAEVRHLRVRGQRKRAMRCRGSNGIETLAAGGVPAHEVVPSSFSRKSNSSRAQTAATGVRDSAARFCRGLETCEWLLHLQGGYCR